MKILLIFLRFCLITKKVKTWYQLQILTEILEYLNTRVSLQTVANVDISHKYESESKKSEEEI